MHILSEHPSAAGVFDYDLLLSTHKYFYIGHDMKKIIHPLMCAATLVAPMVVHAADGSISIVGSVVAATCTLQTKSLTVSLPAVSNSSLSTASATAGATPFSISASCSGLTNSVGLFFEQTSATNTSTGRLLNQASTSAASNIEIQLKYGTTALNLAAANSSSQGLSTVAATTSSAVLAQTFTAQYFATAAATPGRFSSSLLFDLVYN